MVSGCEYTSPSRHIRTIPNAPGQTRRHTYVHTCNCIAAGKEAKNSRCVASRPTCAAGIPAARSIGVLDYPFASHANVTTHIHFPPWERFCFLSPLSLTLQHERIFLLPPGSH